ncbi:hypothetical protein SAMN05192554_1469 [Haloarchaeobius iranensis]|uniref:Uncharacterized protein n=1 Tax=Haloarchaeobius iranensis TaxID=996166 RepID=A0A1H0BR26_9EURY|nr:hypothetical protein SAMN05192554_1469 [Haloarchaeobius iranensis]
MNKAIQSSTADSGAASRWAPSRDEDTSPHTPDLIGAPAVDAQYRAGDTLGETHTKTPQARTLPRLTTYAERYDIPVLVTRNERNEFTEPVATVTDHHLECEQTRIGSRIVGKDFETLVYPVDDRRTTRRRSRTGGSCSQHAPRRSAWILVACFGYQGFSNAKFARIECHEATNAFAREILLTAKQRLEAGGWRVVHGIVDSMWVTPDPDVDDEDREDLQTLATEITERVEIRLEHEAHYDWVAFVPQRESDAGALTKYFGKVAGEDDFKIRGIEARQRSTPPFIEDVHPGLSRTVRRDSVA